MWTLCVVFSRSNTTLQVNTNMIPPKASPRYYTDQHVSYCYDYTIFSGDFLSIMSEPLLSSCLLYVILCIEHFSICVLNMYSSVRSICVCLHRMKNRRPTVTSVSISSIINEYKVLLLALYSCFVDDCMCM